MKKLILLVILTGLLAGCDKRYEEGPCLSFIKAENRICGVWKVQGAIAGNLDIPQPGLDTLQLYTFNFNINSSKALFLWLSGPDNTILAECLVRPDERYTTLSFQLLTIEGYETAVEPLLRHFPALAPDQAWEIDRLKRNEMWLSHYGQDGQDQLRFELLYDHQSH